MAAEGVAETALLSHAVTSDKVTTPASPSLKIFYYNPEINASRNTVLKNTWDTYLDPLGKLVFQPVDRRSDFDDLLQKEASAVFIMSEWLFDKLDLQGNEFYKVALQGLKDGADTYHRILVGHDNEVDLATARIASSGDKGRSLALLAEIFPELSASQIAQLKLLQVPKDIDALMALGYGLADLALGSEVSLSSMARLNQNRFQQLKVIRQSKPLSQSIVVLKSIKAEDKSKLIQRLLSMPDSESGQQAMSLIGLDNWKIIDPELNTMLSRTNRNNKNLVAEDKNDRVLDSTQEIDRKNTIDRTNHQGGRDE
jgi:hypothetical protein